MTDRPDRGEIRKLLSDEEYEQLREVYGGLKIRIPKQPTPTCRLACAIGIDPAKRLAAMLGGVKIYVPRPDAELKARNDRIARMRRTGSTVNEIAQRVGLSERQVSTILSTRRRAAP